MKMTSNITTDDMDVNLAKNMTQYCQANSTSTFDSLTVIPIYLVCPPFIVLLNGFVLFIVYKYVKIADRFDQWFVIGITLSDFVWGLIMTSTSPYQPFLDEIPKWLCKPYISFVWFCNLCSVMFLLLLNINRFVTLFLPFKFHSVVSRRKTVAQIAVVVISVTIFVTIFTTQLRRIESDQYRCRIVPDTYQYLILLVMFYICPLLLSFLISVSIFLLAQSKTAKDQEQKLNDRNSKSKLMKRIFFVFSYTAWTAITCLPYRITYFTLMVCRYYQSQLPPVSGVCLEECVKREVSIILMCLLPVCGVFNPVITIVTQQPYRKGVKKLINKGREFLGRKLSHRNSHRYSSTQSSNW